MSTSTPVARPSRRQRKPRSDLKLGLAFILPATIGLVAFYIWPLIRGIWLSFTEYNLLTPEEFTGLDNYKRMVQDDTFWNAVVVTVEYVVINIGLQTVLALLIAVLMQRLTQSTFVRSIVLTPYLVSNVVAAMLWLWILDNTLGITNQLLESLTGSAVDFFSSSMAIPTIAIINVWRHVGYTALLIFAGLQSIPNTVYEAGKMDGASEWRMFWRITVPLLRPILALVLIMTMIGSFQVFDTVSVATQGGPVNATRVLQYYIYDMAFGRFQFGYASAMAVGLLLVLAAITILQYRMTRAGETDLDRIRLLRAVPQGARCGVLRGPGPPVHRRQGPGLGGDDPHHAVHAPALLLGAAYGAVLQRGHHRPPHQPAAGGHQPARLRPRLRHAVH